MENIFRIIGYGVLYGISALMFYFLHSHFLFMVLIIMAVAPLIFLLMGWLLRRYLTVTVESRADRYGRQNEEAFFMVRVQNPTWFVSLDTKLVIVVRNTFFGTEGKRIISVPVRARKGYTLDLPIIAEYPGNVQIEVEKVRIKDIMGFHFFDKKLSVSGEMMVMPERIYDVDYETVNLEQGMLESEESTKRGSDFSDVQEIREYIPGDKLMSIHWKLSAKRDILMVKDRVSMSDRQLVVVPELCGANAAELNIILMTAYSMINELIEDKTTVRLIYWSAARYEYEDIRIDYKEEVNEAFARMFYEQTYPNMDEASSHMSSVHPELKAYLHISASGGEAVIRVRENG